MTDQDLEMVHSTAQETHEWLVANAEASQAVGRPLTLNLSARLQRRTALGEEDAAWLSTFSPHTRASSSSASVYFPSARHQQQAILAAGNVLVRVVASAIPVVIILTVSVLAIAAFVGGYVAVLR